MHELKSLNLDKKFNFEAIQNRNIVYNKNNKNYVVYNNNKNCVVYERDVFFFFFQQNGKDETRTKKKDRFLLNDGICIEKKEKEKKKKTKIPFDIDEKIVHVVATRKI